MRYRFFCARRAAAFVLALAVALSFSVFSAGGEESTFGAEEKVGADVAKKDVQSVIREGFYSFRESIDISSYEVLPEELTELFSYILKDDPYLFFVEGQLSYSYQPGGAVLCLKPNYSAVGEEAFEAWEMCRRYVREVAAMATECESELERALFLHDHICANFRYDESLEGDTLYDMIANRAGTCQGYTDLYMALLRECGIESGFIASDEISHIWNYVKIGDEYYHVDVTWDDGDEGYTHRHFLLSDKAARERGHIGWYSSAEISCISEKYIDADLDSLLHEKYHSGDVDHSGEVGIVDIILLREYFECGEGEICKKCADVSGDGSVGGNDLEMLRKKVLRD